MAGYVNGNLTTIDPVLQPTGVVHLPPNNFRRILSLSITGMAAIFDGQLVGNVGIAQMDGTLVTTVPEYACLGCKNIGLSPDGQFIKTIVGFISLMAPALTLQEIWVIPVLSVTTFTY